MLELALAISKAEVGHDAASSADGGNSLSPRASPGIPQHAELQHLPPAGPASSPLRESSSTAVRGGAARSDAYSPYGAVRARNFPSAPPPTVDTSADEALAWRLHQEERDAAAARVRATVHPPQCGTMQRRAPRGLRLAWLGMRTAQPCAAHAPRGVTVMRATP